MTRIFFGVRNFSLFIPRLGLTDHIQDNERIFRLRLDDEDRKRIALVQAKGKDLLEFFGDCGGEYRRPSARKFKKLSVAKEL